MTPWKYYLVLFGSAPIWVLVPIFVVHANGGQKYFVYGMGLLLFSMCIFFAHVLSRKWTVFTLKEGIISFNDISIKIDSWKNYFVNNSGIGLTQFSFKVNSDHTLKILVPNYGENAKKLHEFIQKCGQEQKPIE